MHIQHNYHLQDIAAALKEVSYLQYSKIIFSKQNVPMSKTHTDPWDRDFSSIAKTSLAFARLHMESGKPQGTQFIPL